MKVSWVIENITKEPGLLELADVVKQAGADLFEIKGDYSKATVEDLKRFVAARQAVFDGSLNMWELVRRDVPGIVFIETPQNYRCSSYYGPCGDLLFNDRYAIMPLADVHRNPVVSMLACDSVVFVRPDGGQKQFQARLVELKDLADLARSDHDMPVVVSSPKNISGEWRFVCQPDVIVAMSSYRIRGKPVREPKAPDGAIAMCNRILQRYQPDKLFVLDVCSDDDGNFWLMEFNQFIGAGLYACDKSAIVRAVEGMADTLRSDGAQPDRS